ncbi:universal stress protein, partial [Pseudonocardia abyssalis]
MTGPARPVVAGADGSAASMLAVAWAAAEASRRGLPLTIAHVTGTRPDGPLLAESIVDDARELARSVAPRLAVRTVVRDGDPVEILTDLGRDCALLVVGHRGSDGHPGPGPGSTSEAVARTA